ncbi:lipid A biosynthesis lauroyl acyltransferase [Mesorhizobium sp. NBSH29]|uniref:lipid A biosynthesis lauroyl acyltransferase n=1 Tax=Mesorhizobium sp. NBSH29 TaxID=2654249 RepID=UPI0018968E11|nr:lipid A biosynthesis lauroyl acyltransferase [Mesorhizobium sp. NBSH29]QPC88057.1 lipid A biosynthesis lauroyl acyltransferase [Mesorhizobium sp. NBSH29]
MADHRPSLLRPIIIRVLGALKQLNYWLVAQFALGALMLLRLLPADRALNFADRAARRVGPLVGRHRVALDNLRHAYPEKPESEIEALASDMWGNMARLAVEYVFLDQLFDLDPEAETPGRIEVSGIETFKRLAAETDRPHIIFTAHLGNFELLPVAGATFGLAVTAMFRPPNNPYIAKYVFSTRSSTMGGLLPSRAGAALALARLLEAKGNIGVLVDQKFMHGIRTNFFGRECETSPLVPKLARQYDCDVYPARCIRLPGNRFRLILDDKLDLPRDAGGEIDVTATAQQLTDIVEDWVRQDPGQWMWFHKRWKLSPPKARRKPKS